MSTVRGINAFVIRASNPHGLAEWYARFGLTVSFEHAGGLFGDIRTERGAFCFGLVPPGDTGKSGSACVTLEVENLPGTIASLARDGIAPVRRDDNENGRFALFRDPEGNDLEVWAPREEAGGAAARFQEVIPVLPVRSVPDAVRYYIRKLGFTLRFQDDPEAPRYAGIQRDSVRLHVQWHDEADFAAPDDPRRETSQPMLRFVVNGVDELFQEYADQGVFHERTALRDTPWGTREFAFFDADGNGLTFCRDLS